MFECTYTSTQSELCQEAVLVQYISDTSHPFVEFLSAAPGTSAGSSSPTAGLLCEGIYHKLS